MTKKFRKGQLVIHPQQGVFKLQNTEKREIRGQKQIYLVLKPFFKSRGGLKVFIPQELAVKVGIRRVAKKKDILKDLRTAVRFLKNNPVKDIIEISDELLEEWIKKGDFKSSMTLLGQLFFKLKILKEGKMIERKSYEKILNILSGELAVIKRCSKKFAEKEILKEFRVVFERNL